MKNKTFYFSDENFCYVETVPIHLPFNERHEQVEDAGLRNGIKLLSINPTDPLYNKLIQSTKDCIPSKGKVLRWPFHDGDDTSRDMVIGLITALNKTDKEAAKECAGRINWRISKRYQNTPSTWAWLKYIQHGGKLRLYMFYFWFFLENVPATLLTLLVAKIVGVKSMYDELETTGNFTPKKQFLPKWKQFLISGLMAPSFSLHLMALMFYGIDKKSRYMAWYTRKRAPYNLTIRKMFGEDITDALKNRYPAIPMNDLMQGRHFDITNDVDLRTVEVEDNMSVEYYNAILNNS
jgi:hypothetical protein